jgi:ribosomal protein L11
MGKLLKLIAQEEFEKDPYQIRNRAVRLFKKYAQLPTSITSTAKTSIESPTEDHPPRSSFSSMTLTCAEGSTDVQTLKAENITLKQMIKVKNSRFIELLRMKLKSYLQIVIKLKQKETI